MALATGTRLGPYEILSPLGAGGMGEVYRARDTRLGREVAIKILPEQFSQDPGLEQRFEREAKAISSLNHPNICTLHDVGHQDGIHYLVMEYLEGETLADRLQKGALPLKQALECGMQVAQALEKAHRSGIVHRDLKPGNIMLTKSGAKLLDFGLAKPAPSMAAMASGSAETMSKPLTGEGKVVGTFQYMAPEQVQGRDADARTDIFALGAVLYEMITGQRAFAGKSQISVMSAILEKEPDPVSTVQPLTPPALDHVVQRALAKDPEERWQSAADVRAELKWIADLGHERPQAGAHRGSTVGRILPWVLVALLVAALGALYWRASAPASLSTRSLIAPPEGKTFKFLNNEGAPPALSPDGTRLVFGSSGMLWLRPIDSPSARPLRGTENARFPFWSPDSRSIGFFADGKLRTMEANGGPVSTLCDAPDPRGGSWGKDFIVFAPSIRTPLFRVPVGGGTPQAVTQVDRQQHSTHRWPWFLPDGKHFLYLAAQHSDAKGAQNGIYVGSVEGGQDRRLFSNSSSAIYASGYVLYVSDSNLLARSFDPRRKGTAGEAQLLSEDAADDFNVWRSVVSASENGLLVFQSGNPYAPSQLTWFDRSGKALGTIGEMDWYNNPRLSPDGRRLAVGLGPNVSQEVWVFDLDRGIRTRFTFGSGSSQGPVWSPRGDEIAYTGTRQSGVNMLVRAADGLSQESSVPGGSTTRVVTDWSPDGQYLLYTFGELASDTDQVWAMPLSPGGKAFQVAPAGVLQREATFSPDQHWIAYTSRESGRDEIYVAPFPGPGERIQVSTAGGITARWRGNEIFYLSSDAHLTVAQVAAGPHTFRVSSVHPLFSLSVPTNPTVSLPQFDVSRDGRRIIVNNLPQANTGSTPLTLLTNWAAKLRK